MAGYFAVIVLPKEITTESTVAIECYGPFSFKKEAYDFLETSKLGHQEGKHIRVLVMNKNPLLPPTSHPYFIPTDTKPLDKSSQGSSFKNPYWKLNKGTGVNIVVGAFMNQWKKLEIEVFRPVFTEKNCLLIKSHLETNWQDWQFSCHKIKSPAQYLSELSPLESILNEFGDEKSM
jgi:hypothetical protein